LIAATEEATSRRPENTSVRRVAVIAVGEARRRLDAGQRSLTVAQCAERLARSVVALCGVPDRLREARCDG
jgi:hypothetical protein